MAGHKSFIRNKKYDSALDSTASGDSEAALNSFAESIASSRATLRTSANSL